MCALQGCTYLGCGERRDGAGEFLTVGEQLLLEVLLGLEPRRPAGRAGLRGAQRRARALRG